MTSGATGADFPDDSSAITMRCVVPHAAHWKWASLGTVPPLPSVLRTFPVCGQATSAGKVPRTSKILAQAALARSQRPVESASSVTDPPYPASELSSLLWPESQSECAKSDSATFFRSPGPSEGDGSLLRQSGQVTLPFLSRIEKGRSPSAITSGASGASRASQSSMSKLPPHDLQVCGQALTVSSLTAITGDAITGVRWWQPIT